MEGGDTPAVGVKLPCPGQVGGRRGAVPRHTNQPDPGPQQHQALGVLRARDRGWLGAAWELVLPCLRLPAEQQRACHPVQRARLLQVHRVPHGAGQAH